MRVRQGCFALLMFVCTQSAFADDAANHAVTDMEIIELLGEIEEDTGDLEMALSDEDLDELPTPQEVKNAK